MKIYSNKEIRQLRKEGRVTDEKGEKLKPALLHEKPKMPLTLEERQARALEQIPLAIAKVLQSNISNAEVLLEMIHKIKTEVKISEYPESIKKWKFDVSRNGEGFIKQITAEAM